MKQSELTRVQQLTILGSAAMLLIMAMGMRQTFGLFQPQLVRDFGMTAADFSMALAVQNIAWGLTQPFSGAFIDRFGARPVGVAGAAVYVLGLAIAALSDSVLMFTLGIGVCVGIALSCVASTLALSVAARTVSAARRGVAMGSMSAASSLGMVFVSPLAQSLLTSGGWQVALFAFLALSTAMLPAAFLAGRSDKIEIAAARGAAEQSVRDAVTEAFGHRGYVVMTLAYFVCGLQLVFLTSHLPNYLDVCGLDASISAQALMLIGVFNIIGSTMFGWLGDRYSRRFLLGLIYVLRSIGFAVYFSIPPTPTTTLVFAAMMGMLWLGVAPLIGGLVTHLFGLRFMATLMGMAFFSHQVGSFLGAWGGGVIFASLGSYDRAWQAAVVIGLLAGLLQMTMNVRPSPRVAAERAAAANLVAAAR